MRSKVLGTIKEQILSDPCGVSITYIPFLKTGDSENVSVSELMLQRKVLEEVIKAGLLPLTARVEASLVVLGGGPSFQLRVNY